MGFSEDCAKLERDIRGMTDDVQLIRSAQEALFTQIQCAEAQVHLLRKNIHILRLPWITPLLSEYKKIREELAEAEQNLFALTRSYRDATKALKNLQPKLHVLMSEYKALKVNGGTVIIGNFRGPKNGQK